MASPQVFENEEYVVFCTIDGDTSFVLDSQKSFEQTMKTYLNTCDETKGKANKITVVAALYEFLWNNIGMLLKQLRSYDRLRRVIVERVNGLLAEQYNGVQTFFSMDQEKVMLQVKEAIEKYEENLL